MLRKILKIGLTTIGLVALWIGCETGFGERIYLPEQARNFLDEVKSTAREVSGRELIETFHISTFDSGSVGQMVSIDPTGSYVFGTGKLPTFPYSDFRRSVRGTVGSITIQPGAFSDLIIELLGYSPSSVVLRIGGITNCELVQNLDRQGLVEVIFVGSLPSAHKGRYTGKLVWTGYSTNDVDESLRECQTANKL